MKFTDGYWMVRPGFQINQATQIVDYRLYEDKLILYIATKQITNKGDTLEGAMITMEIQVVNRCVVKVTYDHHKGVMDCSPPIETLEQAEKITFTVADEYVLSFQDVQVVLNPKEWNVQFCYKGKKITALDWRSTAYIYGNNTPFMREQLTMDIGECIYGLGERFTAFVKNGQSIDIWNEDGGTATYQAYKNIPFYLSSSGYGLLVNSNKRVSFEVGSEVVSRVQFSQNGENLSYYLFLGDHPKEILQHYTSLTGKPALPPLWSFGLWLSTSFTTNYDEQVVSHFIQKMEEYDIPLSVFHYDCFWMKENEWCNFEFDPAVFPQPKEMLERLKKKGLKICVWINPYIGQKSPLFEIAMKKGYMLKKSNGDVWQWDKWQAGMGIVDFTNPDACRWFSTHLEKLVELGVDCFKTDFGERIPTDVVYHNHADPEGMHNYYSYLYNKVVFETLEKTKGKDAVVFARSGATGAQKFPVHWGGDCYSNYVSMAESLRGGLSLASSGYGFWSHDISGFESTASPDVYKRWVQFGLLSTHSRLHGSSSYRVPWLFGEEAVAVVGYFSKLKCRLSPYLYNTAIHTATTGIPAMSSMNLNFPEDPTCRYIDTQYMLGENLLVAPIFNENGTATYYLPKGCWVHLLTNEVQQGGQWFTHQYDYFSLPLFVKENTILPMGMVENQIVYEYKNNVVFYLYNVTDADYTFHSDEGAVLGTIHVRRNGDDYDIQHNLSYVVTFYIVDENGTCRRG